MSRVIGIDLRKSAVRIAVIRTGFRTTVIEAFAEVSRVDHPELSTALSQGFIALGDKAQRVDTVVTAVSGGQAFLVPLEFPKSAERKIDELMPFELEAELPLEIDELTFGYQFLARSPKDPIIPCLVACARREVVQGLIDSVRAGAGHEPEKVGVTSLELGELVHLWPGIGAGEPAAIVDIGEDTTDICFLDGGAVLGARTLSLGFSSFPHQTQAFLAQVRQTLGAHASRRNMRPTEGLYLVGEGALTTGLVDLISSSLEIRVSTLTPETLPVGSTLPGLTLDANLLAGYARALGTALHGAKSKGFDLRRGPLAFSRGYGYVKERAPLLLALGVTILVSFIFATWAEGRALDREHEVLAQTLSEVTEATFGEATDSPDEARAMMDRFLGAKPEDPMPYMDGFGAAVALAKAVPGDIVHDVELFDYSKGKLKLRGLVSTTDDAQRVAKALDEDECIQDTKVTKITQVVNSERARYLLEADIRCPFDPQPVEAKKKPGASQ
jgi:general secretion pathway protein L